MAMPMHWYRRFQRGFNQADLLAEQVARRTGLPMIAPASRRWAPRQTGRTLAERKRMPASTFEIRRGAVEGKRILLVDDVLTTGASAGACGRALKAAGACHVSILTVARADRRFGADAIQSNVS
jgi:ComF family protein